MFSDYISTIHSDLLHESRRFYELIKINEFSAKTIWQGHFLISLPQQLINDYYINELYEVMTSGKIQVLYSKNLQNYIKQSPDFLIRVFNDLLAKAKNENFYFEILDEDCINSIIEDNRNIALAKELYLYLKINSKSSSFDHNGEILLSILKVDDKFIIDFLRIEENSNTTIPQLKGVWELENYKRIMINAFEYILEIEYYSRFADFWESIFPQNLLSEYQTRVDDTIKNLIDLYCNNSKAIDLIFDICKNNNIQKIIQYVIQFITLNKDIDTFARMSFIPNFWAGSYISMYERDLEFWQQLDKSVKGIEFLKHKQIIQKKILSCKSHIEVEIKREFLRTVN